MTKKYPRTKNIFEELCEAEILWHIIECGSIDAEPQFVLGLGIAIKAGYLEFSEGFSHDYV